MFFDIFESTTQSAISDYRNNKRSDSNADHAEMNKSKESHVEFYAEIIGKLIGSFRSGIRTFIDDVKNGRREKFGAANEVIMRNQSTLGIDPPEPFLENSTKFEVVYLNL